MANQYSLLDACAFKRIIELHLLPAVYILFMTPQNTELEKLICACKTTTINLRKNDIGGEGAESLADALAENTTITTIDLTDNDIGAEGAESLAVTLAKNTTITTIDLGGNNIGAEGAESLAVTLAKNTTISTINLSGNDIGAEGAKSLADALAKNTTITTIDLGDNNIGAESWRTLKKKGFSLTNLDTFLYGGTGSKIRRKSSEVYYNMKIWGRTRNETSGRLPLFTAAAKSLTWIHVRQILAVNMPVVYDVDGLT